MEGNYKKWLDRINSKQNVLTEDNVGQFMDLELATKSTHTSGDTVLGRDSLTGKAVEIPTSSLGGSGNVDTSNLVPYTGANKDVNIASNYFKTSKGFDFTFDADNYFRTYNNGSYNHLEFQSKDNGVGIGGNIIFKINPYNGVEVAKFDYNNIQINFFCISNEGIFSTKPFESSVGFKTTYGTPNQALRADGGVFDLNTKADLVGGKVPSSQLPSYVDDVLEFANLASFPATGESGKIYIAIDTNLTYRWGGSSYVVMSSSLALGETSSTAYRGDYGKVAYDHSQITGNPHGTTKNDIGLGNVPNLDTTNAVNNSHTHSNKSILDLITEPFTTSLKSLYDGVVTRINNLEITGIRLITSGEITKLINTSGTNTGDETTSSIQTKRPLKTIEGQSLEGSGNIDLTKNDIGLGNVDNTSDLNKPISTATQNALDNKQNAIGYTPENVANKATDLSSPDNTKYPTTLAVANENKKAMITVELISQLTANFYAPNALRINSTSLISGSGTLTLKVNDVAYTLGNLIPQGSKITAETSSSSVYNLISIYE